MKSCSYQNKMTFLWCATLLLSSFSLLLASSASAQSLGGSIGGLDLSASTDNPSPGQSVTIAAKSYSADINAATLTWIAGGKTLAKGIGVTSVTVQAPELGKRLTISVTAIASDGSSFSNSIVVTSGSIDMVIETDGYAPPFFLGKTPVAYQNAVKIVAVPHLANSAGLEYDPRGLVYKWEKGSTVLQDQSGYGKQSVVIPGNIVPRPYDITVTVSSRDGMASGMGVIGVSARSPSVIFYPNDPLYGPLFNNAIGSAVYLGTGRELGVLMVPYGFNAPVSGLGDLSLDWLINNKEHRELASNKSVTLRAPEGTAGSSNILLTVTNNQDILQQARASFSAVFSAGTATSSRANAGAQTTATF